MKRFFCTICKKVKRVQKMPHNVVNGDAVNPYERHGECNRHVTTRVSRTEYNSMRKAGAR